jgi:flavorubredoxin
MAEAVEDAFRYGKLVLATTTYNGEVFPFMREFLHELTERGYKNRLIGIIENGTWAPAAAKTIKKLLDGSDLTYTDTTVTVQAALNDASAAQVKALAKELL